MQRKALIRRDLETNQLLSSNKGQSQSILHQACSEVLSVPLVWILKQLGGLLLCVTEEKRRKACCKTKTGHAAPKAENEKALGSLGLVHMYSALHAKGKNFLICPQWEGMSEIRAHILTATARSQ